MACSITSTRPGGASASTVTVTCSLLAASEVRLQAPVISRGLTDPQPATEHPPELGRHLGLHGGVDTHALLHRLGEDRAHSLGVGTLGGDDPQGVITDQNHLTTSQRTVETREETSCRPRNCPEAGTGWAPGGWAGWVGPVRGPPVVVVHSLGSTDPLADSGEVERLVVISELSSHLEPENSESLNM